MAKKVEVLYIEKSFVSNILISTTIIIQFFDLYCNTPIWQDRVKWGERHLDCRPSRLRYAEPEEGWRVVVFYFLLEEYSGQHYYYF